MTCSRCIGAREAAKRAARAFASGRMTEAATAARQAASHITSKVAESDRIRNLTRRKPHG